MEARGHAESDRAVASPSRVARLPGWALGLIPLVLIAAVALAFGLLGAPGLGERTGPPVEELAVERTVLRPGEIELTLRNDGPDPVTIGQVAVNDAFADFSASDLTVDRLGSQELTIDYPWQEGSPLLVSLLTSTGATIEHEIPVAVETPVNDFDFYLLMALIGLYVGVIPVALGMLWLPFLRRIDARWIRVFMAVTVGLLGFLAVDGFLEGWELAGAGAQAFGGPVLVLLGAALAYFVLSAVDGWLSRRSESSGSGATTAARLAWLVALGIGLHNLGEGLAIGSAYAVGAVALGAFLIIGFALHNTTEGLAIVAPIAHRRPGLLRLAGLGLLAGAPAIAGAWIGASAFNASLAALMIGIGVGAIVRVVQQLVPTMRDESGRALHPAAVGGILAGIAVMYLTGLLIAA